MEKRIVDLSRDFREKSFTASASTPTTIAAIVRIMRTPMMTMMAVMMVMNITYDNDDDGGG